MLSGLPDIVNELARHGKHIVLNTNGELLDDSRVAALRIGHNIQVVGISIDGHDAAAHAAMRRGASFERTIAAFRRVRRIPNVRLKVATVVSEVNLDGMQQMATLVANLQPDVWRLYQYTSRGMGAPNKNRFAITDQVFDEVLARLRRTHPDLSISSSSSSESICFIIDHKGDVLRPSDGGYDLVGNALTHPIDDIWRGQWSQRQHVVFNKRWLESPSAVTTLTIGGTESVPRQ
ncbi:MAG: hypothetical protein AMXMBFR58_29310 [Phycisphaerae bacterium]